MALGFSTGSPFGALIGISGVHLDSSAMPMIGFIAATYAYVVLLVVCVAIKAQPRAWITSSNQSPMASVQKAVVRLVLAYHQVRRRVIAWITVEMVNHRLLRQEVADSRLGYQHMFWDISSLRRSWMASPQNANVSLSVIRESATLPIWIFSTFPISHCQFSIPGGSQYTNHRRIGQWR